MEELVIRPGDVVASKYRVEKVLGAGGMGVVVAARHVTLGNLFAIKVMLPRAVAVKGAVERFEREAQAAAQLQSKHVMKVHDHGKLDSGAPYMVMEHLTGSDLASVIEKNGALPVADAAEYLLQACEAIAEAHAKGIVHRDLKPANLFLLTEPDGTPLIKVLDFGIAKVASAEKGLTGTSQGMGSGGYMSPEQMSSAKRVDHRADIWALGVTLYELLTAHRPFEADSLEQFVARVFYEAPTPLSKHRPDLPQGLAAIVLRCLEKSPDARFSTVAHFAHVLAPYAPPRAQGYAARIARQLGVEMAGVAQTSPGMTVPAAPAPVASTSFGPAPAVAVAAPGGLPGVSPPAPMPAGYVQQALAPTGPAPPAASRSGPYPTQVATGPVVPEARPSGPHAVAASQSGPYAAVGARSSTVPASAPMVGVATVPGGAPAPAAKRPPVALFLAGGLLLVGLGAGGVWLTMRSPATAELSGGSPPAITTTVSAVQTAEKPPETPLAQTATAEPVPAASASAPATTATTSGKPVAPAKTAATSKASAPPTSSASAAPTRPTRF